ncbi:MAG: FxsA family protein [Pseudomonadales bacterium]|nr:FxsA family protein [Pseudomonadales bacterium]
MRFLLPLFIVIPIIEMWVLIQVGGMIGAWPTIGLVLLTAMIGLHLLKQQGLSTLMRANQKMAEGNLPAEEMLEGIALAIGGALLLTPGFFTDAIGFVCLLPFTRKLVVKQLLKKGLFMAASQMQGGAAFQAQFNSSAGFTSSAERDDVIDGEFTRDGQDKIPKS